MLGQTKFIHRANARIDNAKDDIGAETLTDDAGPISSVAVGVSKIGVTALKHQCALVFGKKGVG